MKRVYIREEELEGIDNWMWPDGDVGLWQGPAEEWPIFKELFLNHIRGRRTCIQAGGAAGVYPRLLANVFEHVHTFEPDKLNFHCLVNNCRFVENVTFYNAAVGEHSGEVSFVRSHPLNAGMHRVVCHRIDHGERIQQVRIDDFHFSDVDFLMLDIEYYEYYAMKGAVVTILKNKPLIQLENAEHREMLELLHELEYVKVDEYNEDSFWKYRYYV